LSPLANIGSGLFPSSGAVTGIRIQRAITSACSCVAEGEYTPKQIKKLSAVRKRQFLAAAKKFLPGRYASPHKFFEAFAKDAETTIDGLTATCWRIAIKDKPATTIYEMWTFLVDNGTVFAAGKAKPSGVQMIQGAFEAENQTPKLRALVADLERVVPF
jgi:hypothetical protein